VLELVGGGKGENVGVTIVFLLLDLSDHDVTPPVVADKVIVDVCLASNHNAKLDNLEGLNLSSNTGGAVIPVFLLYSVHDFLDRNN
jgi:hypothetical protein